LTAAAAGNPGGPDRRAGRAQQRLGLGRASARGNAEAHRQL